MSNNKDFENGCAVIIAMPIILALVFGLACGMAFLTQLVSEGFCDHPLPFWPLVAGWSLIWLVVRWIKS